ncbi:HAD family hydrolase [Methylohalobius crimeensis]|uniref:HAD family hydrolase n=1 Tax=Methylohalobius crimeensis TaxID=244365 RepID=UPI0003B36A57|nr:HAD-IA family hydrolase [Methylohalobius crimeensis]
MSGLRCILLDLDGTLLDTAPDLAFALNAVLTEEGREPLPLATVRPAVSHGARGLIRLGFGEDGDASARRMDRLISVYRKHLADRTRLFDGMAEVLQEVESQGMTWGVVTNKRRDLTLPLLDRLQLRERAACVVSGDDTSRNKPHPDPLWLACRQAGVDPAHCIYVGDAERDIEAGRRAGMGTVVARYGYLAPDARPEGWGADALVETPRQLSRIFRERASAIQPAGKSKVRKAAGEC